MNAGQVYRSSLVWLDLRIHFRMFERMADLSMLQAILHEYYFLQLSF